MFKRSLLIGAMLLFMGQAAAPTETVAQLEARLKTLKTQVAEVETKLAAARAAQSPKGISLTSLLANIPANLQWKDGESERTRAERGEWILSQVKDQPVACTIEMSSDGKSGRLLPLSISPATIAVVLAFTSPPAEKLYGGDTVEVKGILKSADFIKAKGGYAKMELGDAVVVKVTPKK